MTDDHEASDSSYDRFIQQARSAGEVWGLQSEDGWAYCASNVYEDAEVIIFWSDRAMAQQHAAGEWSGHTPAAIPLEEFVESWLRGMHEDGALAGLNWDEELDGLEVEPSELAAKLTDDEE
jgi:hypothetical protein